MAVEQPNNYKYDSTSNNPSDKDPMVVFVEKEFERFEKAHKDRFEEAKEIIEQWENKPPQKSYDWMNAVHVPITFASEQTITPRVFAAIFPTDTPIDVVVYGDQTTEEQGIKIKTALQHNFKQANVQNECLTPLTQNTLLGTGYVETPYLYRKGWVIDPKTGERRSTSFFCYP